MTFSHDKDPTEFFSVVGAAYIPEHHEDPDHLPESFPHNRQQESCIAGLWLLFYAVIIGASMFSHSAAKVIQIASVALN